jgi:hypothetical protein
MGWVWRVVIIFRTVVAVMNFLELNQAEKIKLLNKFLNENVTNVIMSY